jgi:glycosyltransferase involved in cell wall biosynthesis
MKIEMLANALPTAGLEMVIAYLVRGLSRRGHDVGVTCIEQVGELGERLRNEGHRVSVVTAPGLRTNLRPAKLVRWFRQIAPDVVHVHSGAWLKGVTAAKQAGVPGRVYTLHGIYPVEPWYLPYMSRMAANRTHVAVAVSETLRTYLLERVRMPASRVRVVGNGVDVGRFSPGERDARLARRIGIPPGAFVVGTVARLHPVKNHALLVDAFAAFSRTYDDAVLVIVGEGELRSELLRRATDLGIADRLFLPGTIADTAPVYRLFDVFVLSSVIEGTSMSALEAMASGVPVLATAVGGNPHLLDHGGAGLLVPSQETKPLRDALARLAGDADQRADLARRGRQRVVDFYSDDAMLDAYEAIYSAAVGAEGFRRTAERRTADQRA